MIRLHIHCHICKIWATIIIAGSSILHCTNPRFITLTLNTRMWKTQTVLPGLRFWPYHPMCIVAFDMTNSSWSPSPTYDTYIDKKYYFFNQSKLHILCLIHWIQIHSNTLYYCFRIIIWFYDYEKSLKKKKKLIWIQNPLILYKFYTIL